VSPELGVIVGSVLGFVLVHGSFAVAYARPVHPRGRPKPSDPGVMLRPWHLDPFFVAAPNVRNDR